MALKVSLQKKTSYNSHISKDRKKNKNKNKRIKKLELTSGRVVNSHSLYSIGQFKCKPYNLHFEEEEKNKKSKKSRRTS